MVVFIRGVEHQQFADDSQESIIANGDTLWCLTEECLRPGILIKTLNAFRWLVMFHPSVDFIYRTNISSFVDLNKLKLYCRDLPRARQFHGRMVTTVEHDVSCLSGSGYLLSRDVVEYLIAHQNLLNFGLYDDQAVSQLLLSYLEGRYTPIDSVIVETVDDAQAVIDGRVEVVNQPFHYRIKLPTDRRHLEYRVHRRLRHRTYFSSVEPHKLHRLIKIGDVVEYHPSIISREQAWYSILCHGGRTAEATEINEQVVRVYHHGRLVGQWPECCESTHPVSIDRQWCFVIIALPDDNDEHVSAVRERLMSYGMVNDVDIVYPDGGITEWFGNARLAGYMLASRRVYKRRCDLVLIVESSAMFPPNFGTYLRSLTTSINISHLGSGLVSNLKSLANLDVEAMSTLLKQSSYGMIRNRHDLCSVDYILANYHRVQRSPALTDMVRRTPDEQIMLVRRLTLNTMHRLLLLSSRYPSAMSDLRDYLWNLQTPLTTDEYEALKIRLSRYEPVYSYKFIGDHWCDSTFTRLHSKLRKNSIVITTRTPRPEHILYWTTIPGVWIKLVSSE